MRLLIILLTLSLSSCAFLPKGKSVLKNEVDEDRDKVNSFKEKYQGKPIYVEVQTYPQLTKEGHIIQGGEELLKIGHEEVSLKETLDQFYRFQGIK